jgi:O-antigen/teichoic acid export membrane protein
MSTLARHATRQRAARDILMQVVVRIGNLLMGVFVTALVVRTLGDAGYGEWSTLFVVLGLVGYFANFGMEGVALREAARTPEHEGEWIGSVMLLRLLVLAPVMLISLGADVALERSNEMLIAGLILILVMPFSGVSAIGLLFQLRVDNRVPMIVLTLRSVLWGIAVVIIYFKGGGMIALAIAMAVSNTIGSLVQVLAVRRLKVPWPRPTRKHVRPLLRIGMPLGVAGVLILAYARIDQVIVFVIAGSKAAGLYAVVYNLLSQAQFVPVSILTTLSPVLAASWPHDRPRLLRTARLTADLLAVTSFGALAFACVAATPIVLAIFGPEFLPAAPAMVPLGITFVFICFGYLSDNILFVLGLQRRRVVIGVAALVINVIGNIILVPIFGFMGAAWMTLVTEIVVLGAGSRLLLRTLELPRPKLGRVGRTAIAALVLAAILEGLSLASNESLWVLIPAACVFYPALLFGLRALTLDEVLGLVRRRQLA